MDTKMKKVARAAEGGVLLVQGADCLKDSEKSSDRLGEEALQSVTKLLETASMATEWPQRPDPKSFQAVWMDFYVFTMQLHVFTMFLQCV